MISETNSIEVGDVIRKKRFKEVVFGFFKDKEFTKKEKINVLFFLLFV
jgi:hypothetical protein